MHRAYFALKPTVATHAPVLKVIRTPFTLNTLSRVDPSGRTKLLHGEPSVQYPLVFSLSVDHLCSDIARGLERWCYLWISPAQNRNSDACVKSMWCQTKTRNDIFRRRPNRESARKFAVLLAKTTKMFTRVTGINTQRRTTLSTSTYYSNVAEVFTYS